jgi:hypothetical protein
MWSYSMKKHETSSWHFKSHTRMGGKKA